MRDVEERMLYGGAAQVDDTGLVALLVGAGAGALIDATGGLECLGQIGVRELMSRHGLQPSPACRLAAAVELARRIRGLRKRRGERIERMEDVERLFGPALRVEVRERFCTIALDARNQVLGEALVVDGTQATVEVYPRQAFAALLREDAAAALFVHNHPSGDPTPSAEDLRLSMELLQVGEVVGVPVLDHVVIAASGAMSAMPGGRSLRSVRAVPGRRKRMTNRLPRGRP
jgi:DNA repair protein RadC